MVYDDAAHIPQLADLEVLVKFHAAALNSRDASIPYVSLLCVSEDVQNTDALYRELSHSVSKKVLSLDQMVPGRSLLSVAKSLASQSVTKS